MLLPSEVQEQPGWTCSHFLLCFFPQSAIPIHARRLSHNPPASKHSHSSDREANRFIMFHRSISGVPPSSVTKRGSPLAHKAHLILLFSTFCHIFSLHPWRLNVPCSCCMFPDQVDRFVRKSIHRGSLTQRNPVAKPKTGSVSAVWCQSAAGEEFASRIRFILLNQVWTRLFTLWRAAGIKKIDTTLTRAADPPPRPPYGVGLNYW